MALLLEVEVLSRTGRPLAEAVSVASGGSVAVPPVEAVAAPALAVPASARPRRMVTAHAGSAATTPTADRVAALLAAEPAPAAETWPPPSACPYGPPRAIARHWLLDTLAQGRASCGGAPLVRNMMHTEIVEQSNN